MEITTKMVGTAHVVLLGGRLDTTAAATFDAGIRELIGAGATRVILDATALSYVSSAGLRSLLTLQKQLKGAAGAGLALAGVQPFVLDILNIAGFTKILTLTPTVEAAVAALDAPL